MKIHRLVFLMLLLPMIGKAQIFDCKRGGGNYYKVTALSGLNIRKDPDLDSDKIYKLAFGTEIFACDYCMYCEQAEIDNIKGVWKKIYYGDYCGYVFDGYLKALEKIEIMCPYDWQSQDMERSVFTEKTRYFGVYRLSEFQSKTMLYEGRDTLVASVPFIYKTIKINDSTPPDFIVSGIDLEDEQVIEGEFYNSRAMYPGESIRFGNSCLYVTGTPVLSQGDLMPFSGIENYKFIIRENDNQGNHKENILFNKDYLTAWGGGQYEGGIRLIWAGDIDGDNKMDVLFSFSTHYAYYQVILMLSTKAEGENLLGEAARYGVSSC